MAGTGFVINRSNMTTLRLSDIKSINEKEFWHRFIIAKGALFNKDDVLEAILDCMDPVDLVPVKTLASPEEMYCLLNFNNYVSYPLSGLDRCHLDKVNISIVTCYIPVSEYKVNMQHLLRRAIEKRKSQTREGHVDLTMFHKEPELYDILFCPLSRPKILVYVLSILKRIMNVTSINLSNNGIEKIKGLEVLQDFKDLVSLNLSRNKIPNVEFGELIGKIVPKLESLNLRGNPVCSSFESEQDYISWISKCFPSIKMVDDIPLNCGVPCHQFWLCDNTCWSLINEFLRHYFYLFDNNRKALRYMYCCNSIFSLTTGCLPATSLMNQESLLECYYSKSRTLLKVCDKQKIIGPAYYNNSALMDVLCKLPNTKHLLGSFKVDVLSFQENSIILNVSGLFKDLLFASELKTFYRTFVIRKFNEDYIIMNDMLCVTSTRKDEINDIAVDESLLPFDSIKIERRKKTELISELTGMNVAYSRRCLQDCFWNVREALEAFLKNFENSSIPQEAFTA